MAVTSWHSPTANVVAATGVTWTNPQNVYASDDVYAVCDNSAGGANHSKTLTLTGFGFSADIPAGAVILGIEVQVERHCSSAAAASEAVDTLILSSVGFGTDQSTGANWQATTDEVVTFGGPTNLWGATPTYAQVTDTTFGFRLSCNIAAAALAYVDNVQMRIYYNATVTATASSAPVTSASRQSALPRASSIVSTAVLNKTRGYIRAITATATRVAALSRQAGKIISAAQYFGPQSFTNSILQSQTFDNASWAKAALASVTPNAVAAPDGTMTADLLTEDATLNVHYVNQTPVTQSGNCSVYAKMNGRRFLYIYLLPRGPTDSANQAFAYFDLQLGTCTAPGGAMVATIDTLANGWFRCNMTGVVAPASTSREMRIGLSNSSGIQSYTGDGVSGIYIWQAQITDGSVTAPPIPTTTAAVTMATTTIATPRTLPRAITSSISVVGRRLSSLVRLVSSQQSPVSALRRASAVARPAVASPVAALARTSSRRLLSTTAGLTSFVRSATRRALSASSPASLAARTLGRPALALSSPVSSFGRTFPLPTRVGYDFMRGVLPPGATLTRASIGTYISPYGEMLVAGVDVPRFTYDQFGGLQGLLVEPASTNLYSAGEDLSLVDSLVNTRFDILTPTSDLLIEGLVTGVPSLQCYYDVAIGDVHYWSAVVWPYAGTLAKRYFFLRPARNLPGDPQAGCSFDVEAGTVYGQKNVSVGTATSIDGTRTRVSMTRPAATATVPGNHFDLQVSPIGSTGQAGSYLMDGLSGVHCQHIQVERDRLTSYIPTNGAVASRAADVLVLDWGRLGINDGTIFVRYRFPDGTIQTVSAVVAGGLSTVPTNLNQLVIQSAETAGSVVISPLPRLTRLTNRRLLANAIGSALLLTSRGYRVVLGAIAGVIASLREYVRGTEVDVIVVLESRDRVYVLNDTENHVIYINTLKGQSEVLEYSLTLQGPGFAGDSIVSSTLSVDRGGITAAIVDVEASRVNYILRDGMIGRNVVVRVLINTLLGMTHEIVHSVRMVR